MYIRGDEKHNNRAGKELVRRITFGRKIKQAACLGCGESTSVTPVHKPGESGRTRLYKTQRARERSLDLIWLAIGSHRMLYEQGSSRNSAN